jgi:hypothetical protein
MGRKKETDPESLPEGSFTVIPGVGIGVVVRKKVPIYEHSMKRRGYPCPEEFGMEVELLTGGDLGGNIKLVCKRCYSTEVIEDLREE